VRHGKPRLADRVRRAAEAALAAQGFVCPLDVLLGIGWLSHGPMRHWQRGGFGHLEDAAQIESSRLAEAMKLFRGWTIEKGLSPSVADYVARTPQRQMLRFTRDGSPAIEEQYRTHWVSAEVSEKERGRLVEKASRPPELVVISRSRTTGSAIGAGGWGISSSWRILARLACTARGSMTSSICRRGMLC
jgi:hypothetical protein